MDPEPTLVHQTTYDSDDQETQIEILKRLPLSPEQLDTLLTDLGCKRQHKDEKVSAAADDYDDLKEEEVVASSE